MNRRVLPCNRQRQKIVAAGTGNYDEIPQISPLYEKYLDYNAPDLELIDVNDDEKKDIYIVQSNTEDSESYCGKRGAGWPSNLSFVPPIDEVQDYLLFS